ncbi:hypothetical protein N7495_005548 [Penicillium taxi]|uniref:uncharacterized protein n=1 Tax=Penicillium taxi TaxID=168475 RepID=UPI0025450438|nr:uncharacterized protein N7495_005548 [Penicillium taxi]KAJ5893857.1 hypothetical protein N7495_005548 [Penicillium taxi]
MTEITITSNSSSSNTSSHALSFWAPETSGSSQSVYKGSLTVDRLGFLKSSNRAGGPVLCSLPAYCESVNFTSGSRFDDNAAFIEDETAKILVKHAIQYKSVNALGRRSKVNPEPEPVPTVFVLLPKKFPAEDLYKAAKEIHNSLSGTFPGISIELINGKLDLHPSCYPVLSSTSIFSKWYKISGEIIAKCWLGDWTALELWHYGVEPEPTRNPITVLISIKEGSTANFFTSTQKIVGILAMNQEPNAEVLFIKNNVRNHVQDSQLPWNACGKQALPGVSLGIHNSSAGSSTLGGNVELRWPSSPVWRTYAITCFHAIYPPRGPHRDNLRRIKDSEEALDKWEFSPLRSNFTIAQRPEEVILRIDHPSKKDIERSIDVAKVALKEEEEDGDFQKLLKINKLIKEGSDEFFLTPLEIRSLDCSVSVIATMKESLNHMVRFYRKKGYMLGHVFCGSGLHRTCSTTDGRSMILDWALVHIGKHEASVKPFNYGGNGISPQTDFLELTVTPKGSLEATEGKTVFKTGRSTGLSQATWGTLCQVSFSREQDPSVPGGSKFKATWEHCITSPSNKPFSELGDSGSLVWLGRGRVVGILHSGGERVNTSYITPIEDIFEDIKRISGACEVRMKSLPP